MEKRNFVSATHFKWEKLVCTGETLPPIPHMALMHWLNLYTCKVLGPPSSLPLVESQGKAPIPSRAHIPIWTEKSLLHNHFRIPFSFISWTWLWVPDICFSQVWDAHPFFPLLDWGFLRADVLPCVLYLWNTQILSRSSHYMFPAVHNLFLKEEDKFFTGLGHVTLQITYLSSHIN